MGRLVQPIFRSNDLGKEKSPVKHESTCNEAMVFSSTSPKIFGNDAALNVARVNSNRPTKDKTKNSFVKAKHVFYDAGPLVVECHKKRRSSIQSVGEDASSIKPP